MAGHGTRLVIDRIRNAFRALFARNPTITVEVVGETWSCQWKRMTPEDAARLMRGIADEVADRALSEVACSATVH